MAYPINTSVNSPPQIQSNTQPTQLLQQIPTQVDLDSIPLDHFPEFLPHDPHTPNPPNFSSNSSFSSLHGFPSGGDLNFSPNPSFSSPQEPTLSSPGSFESSHNSFTSNTGSFSNGFGPHSHEFILHPHPKLSPSQANTFSDTAGFSAPNDFPLRHRTGLIQMGFILSPMTTLSRISLSPIHIPNKVHFASSPCL